jgi:GT2 family glycosyltransferase
MIQLLIYIPTFNRPDALTKQLSSLVPQIARYQENVRVIVRDNCSDNDALSVLKIKYHDHKNIFFEENFGNIGGNANIALGFIFAKKDEFLWILSDNDLISHNAIENLMEILNLRIDFVVCI